MPPRPYNSSRRLAAAADTRQTILDAALALFEERGYASTTVAEVADRADVALNTIYVSIGGKPRLLVELIEQAATDKRISAAMEQVRDAESAGDVIRAVASGTRDNLKDHSWLLGTLYDNAASDPTIAGAADHGEDEYRRNLSAAAQKLENLSSLRADVPVTVASDVLWFYFGFRAWRDLRARGWGWDRAAEWLSVQALAALT